MDNIDFNEARVEAFEHKVSKINSRLSSSVERVACELEELKAISDSISTLYEDMDKLPCGK